MLLTWMGLLSFLLWTLRKVIYTVFLFLIQIKHFFVDSTICHSDWLFKTNGIKIDRKRFFNFQSFFSQRFFQDFCIENILNYCSFPLDSKNPLTPNLPNIWKISVTHCYPQMCVTLIPEMKGKWCELFG